MQKLGFLLRTILGTIVFLILLIPVLGPPLYVEVGNLVAPGVVVGKREEITVRRTTWTRRLVLDVRYEPAGGEPEQTGIYVEASRYDRTPVGTPVQVRYLPLPEVRQLGDIAAARLADQPPFGPLLARLAPARWLLIGLAAWVVLLVIWNRWRRWWLALPLVVGMLGGGLYAVSNWPAPAPPGPQLTANATVGEIHQVERLVGRRRGATELAQPYTIVELSFVPQGATGPVLAVDLIDAGSAAGLEPGSTLPIRYSAADPRWAQIDGATRTYAWKNLRIFGVIALVILILLVGAWFGRRNQVARRARQPAR